MAAEREKLIDDALLYGSAFVVSASGVRAVMMTLQEPGVERAFMLALAMGFALSWVLRRYEALLVYGPAWTTVLAALALAWYWQTGTFLGQPLAAMVGPDRQLELGVGLAGLTVVRSFGLVSTADLLFCVVPSLAIFGLMGSKTFDPQFTVAFVVYVFASAYLAGHAHLMTERAQARHPRGDDTRQGARGRFVVLVVLVALAVGVAVPAARAMAALLPSYEPAARRMAAAGGAVGGGAAGGRALWYSARTLPVGQGPVRLSQRVIMRVACPEPLYWRAASLAHYTGQAWRATEGLSARVTRGPGGAFDLRPVVKAVPGRLVRQRFEFVGIQAAILFGAAQPVEVRLPAGVGPVVVSPSGATFTVRGRIRQDETYEVVSQVDNLRAAASPSVLAADEPELLAIPLSARQVEDFAREAVGDTTDPATQVAAIVNWVRARARYSLDAAATPTGEDAVMYFLTRSRVGYCDLFASAVALMCRAVQIPARVAIGFAPGEYDPASGVYVVRERDAHAWVEAYLPDTGWTTVDAAPATAQQAQAAAQRDWLRRVTRLVSRNTGWAVAALAILAWAALAAKAKWLDPYMALRRQERRLVALGYSGIVILCYQRLLWALARRGLARRDWETPSEYARRLGKNAYLAALMPQIKALTAAYLTARFSAREMSDDEAQQAREALERVSGGLAGLKGLR